MCTRCRYCGLSYQVRHGRTGVLYIALLNTYLKGRNSPTDRLARRCRPSPSGGLDEACECSALADSAA